MPLCRVFIILACLCALLLLPACSGGDKQQMLSQLEELERQNRADSVMRNDSLAEQLVEYFDRHGTPNERMRAHYILGRTYADMGEAPAAVNAYLAAADAADTIAKDCDYYTLSRVYGQMAYLLYSQNLLDDCIRNTRRSIDFAKKDGDKEQQINEYAHLIVAYDRQEQFDSVIDLYRYFQRHFLDSCDERNVAIYSLLPVKSLLKKNRMDEAKRQLDMVEKKSGYFDAANNVEAGREVYYYYKGQYFLHTLQYDSAEYYFRKELLTGRDILNQDMASRGLSLLFQQKGQYDSVAKYSLYSYEMNDSVYTRMATLDITKMQSLYNYGRFQAKALQEHKTATQRRYHIFLLYIIMAVVFFLVFLAFVFVWKRKLEAKREFQRKSLDLQRAEDELENLRLIEKEVQILRDSHSSIQKQMAIDLGQKDEEVYRLKQLDDKYSERISSQEKVIADLRSELSRFKLSVVSEGTLDGFWADATIACQSVKNKLDKGLPLTKQEYQYLETRIVEKLPVFNHFLKSTGYTSDSKKWQVCVFLRLGLAPKIMAGMLDVSVSEISKISSKVIRECFNAVGSTKELGRKLAGMN